MDTVAGMSAAGMEVAMNVLITGAASGIGLAVSEHFIAHGHRVWGIDLAPLPDREGLSGFVADITDEMALNAVSNQLRREGIALDAILNIAGIHRMASLVESDCHMMKRVIEINLVGALLVNRVFHANLCPGGRIVIVTSEVAGFDPMPFNGLYSFTKTALDSYAQALRQELNLIGQKVVTVRPGAVDTPLSRGSVLDTRELSETTALYRNQAKSFSGLASKFMGRPIPPEVLGSLIYRAATAKHPRPIYRKHSNPGLVLLNLLPKSWQCGLIKWLLELGLF